MALGGLANRGASIVRAHDTAGCTVLATYLFFIIPHMVLDQSNDEISGNQADDAAGHIDYWD